MHFRDNNECVTCDSFNSPGNVSLNRESSLNVGRYMRYCYDVILSRFYSKLKKRVYYQNLTFLDQIQLYGRYAQPASRL